MIIILNLLLILLLILFMLLFKGDNDDNNIELAIDIVITKHNGEKSPLTKSYLKSLKSLAKSFINNRSTNRT
jgi:hypothetical protein